MTFTIRPADLADIPAITEIYRPYVEDGFETFELVPPDTREMTARYEKVIEANCPYLVAEKEDVVIGYAYAGPFHQRPAYRHTVENSVYLAQDMRRQGIGSALLQALIEACEARGFRQMIALITRLDPPKSVSLHQKFGFRHVGIIENVGFKHGRWLDVTYMQRSLGAGATTDP